MPRVADADIPMILAQYLKCESTAEKEEYRSRYSDLFSEEVVVSLEEARADIRSTLKEVQEACRLIHAVSHSLGSLGGGTDLQPTEAAAVAADDAIILKFTTALAQLLRNGAPPPTLEAPGSSDVALLPSSPVPSAAKPSSGTVAEPWHQQQSIVFEVLSFLPAKFVLMVGEAVCAAWQHWLYVPEVSRAFWVGSVHREYPLYLKKLLATGEDLFASDWRSIAMLCVTADEEDAEEAALS